MRRMYRKVTAGVIAAAMLMGMSGCGSSKPAETAAAATKAETTAAATEAATTEAATEAAQAAGEKTEIQVFIAASLNTVMQDLAKQYNEQHPEVTITFNADSSGKLLTQIEEGYACDVFFSASQKSTHQRRPALIPVESKSQRKSARATGAAWLAARSRRRRTRSAPPSPPSATASRCRASRCPCRCSHDGAQRLHRPAHAARSREPRPAAAVGWGWNR